MIRRRPSRWLLLAFIGVFSAAGLATASEPLVLDTEPTDLDELRTQADDVETASVGECGGLLPDEHVGEELGDAIAAVFGLPGREGKPLEAVLGGLGVKREEGGQMDDGFEFPDSAKGFSTRCELGRSAVRKLVQAADLLTYVRTPMIAAPEFGDPPCLTTPGDCEDFCQELNDFTYPDCAVLKGDFKRGIGCALWCLKETCTDGWTDTCNTSLNSLTNGAVGDSPAVPELSLYKGQLVFEKDGLFVSYDTLQPVLNDDGNFISFGETEEYNEPITIETPEPQYPNCTPCVGEQCRCSLQPVEDPEKDPVCLLDEPDLDVGEPDMQNLPADDAEVWLGCRRAVIQALRNADRDFDQDNIVGESECQAFIGAPSQGLPESPGVYPSFFRQYDAFISRRAFTNVAPQDQNEASAQVACYGFYDEFDPLDRQTKMIPGEEPDEAKDARCVINLDTEQFPDTQKGIGNLPQSDLTEDFTTYGREEARISPWFQQLAGAFSLLHSADLPLPNAVLTINETDTASLHALPLLHLATIPDFDETGIRRAITTWWADLSTNLAEALRPPRMTVILPRLPNDYPDADDPLFTAAIAEHDASNDPTTPLEVQLNVGEDLAGRVSAFLERDALFRLREAPMPVIVPAASADDLRALAQSWCTYGATLAPGASGQGCSDLSDINNFANRLEEYAARIEAVAELRAEIDHTLATLLRTRQESLDAIASWRDQVTELLIEPTEDLQRLKALQERWQGISRAYAAVGAVTNMPWCMNQRFTLPIYWLLDPWLSSREDDGKITMNGLPLPGFAVRPPDLELDLSLLHLQSSTIDVPVLKPIQVRLDFQRLSPPGSGDEQTTSPPRLPDLPSLQPIKDALEAAREQALSVSVLSEPPLPDVPDVLTEERESALRTSLDETEGIIESMDDAYHRFWDPLLPEHHDEREALSCEFWGKGICHYSEMELLETLMRMMSRVGVFLKEDLLHLSPLLRQTSPMCSLTDGGCAPYPPTSRPPSEGWQVAAPSDDDQQYDDPRRDIRETTLPDGVNDLGDQDLQYVPWLLAGPDLLNGLSTPDAVDVIPSSSSSSAL